MVPLLFSPSYSKFSFPPQQNLKDFRNLKELKGELTFQGSGKRTGGCKAFARRKKKRNLGVPKGSEYWSLSAPQEEHLAAQAKDTNSLLPADQELPGQSRAEPCIATDCIPLLFLCSMAFSEWVSPPLAGVEISAL